MPNTTTVPSSQLKSDDLTLTDLPERVKAAGLTTIGLHPNDIREMIKRIEKQLKKRKFNFEKDVDNYDMLVLRLQIIGQSVNELPKEITAKFPEVNWKIFVTFRNISSHNYCHHNRLYEDNH